MNLLSRKKIVWVCLLLLFITISGCSGGGGGGGDTPPGNTAPAISAGCSNTFQSNQMNGMLVATDVETPNAISFSLDVNNPMAAGPVTTANGGMVVLTNTTSGAFTYTPPAGGQRGRDTFRFRVDDPSAFSTATETIIVNPKIMPLGDSITFGAGSVPQVSYRLQLLNRLTANNQSGGAYQIEYVGELSSGANLLPARQRSHAGYSGCHDQHIAGGGCPVSTELNGIFTELNANPADIVLLHVGTNQPAIFDTSANDVEAILNEIGRWEDSVNGNPVSVVVMQTINKIPNEPNVAIYNANVINRINNPVSGFALPDQIIFDNAADMYTAFGGATPNATLYADATHPNSAGYIVMGNILYNALTGPSRPAILQRCP